MAHGRDRQSQGAPSEVGEETSVTLVDNIGLRDNAAAHANANATIAIDNEATNCSETMSTNDDAADLGPLLFDQNGNIESPTYFKEQLDCQAEDQQSNLMSVKDRISTPRRTPLLIKNIPQTSDTQQSDIHSQIRLPLAGTPPQPHIPIPPSITSIEPTGDAGLTTDDPQTEPTLSMISGLQAPPSYGTACAQLDVGQLQRNLSLLVQEDRQRAFQNSGTHEQAQCAIQQNQLRQAKFATANVLMDQQQDLTSRRNNSNLNNVHVNNNNSTANNSNANNHFSMPTGSSLYSLSARPAMMHGPGVLASGSQTMASLPRHLASAANQQQQHENVVAGLGQLQGNRANMSLAGVHMTAAAATGSQVRSYSSSLPRIHWLQQAQLQQQARLANQTIDQSFTEVSQQRRLPNPIYQNQPIGMSHVISPIPWQAPSGWPASATVDPAVYGQVMGVGPDRFPRSATQASISTRYNQNHFIQQQQTNITRAESSGEHKQQNNPTLRQQTQTLNRKRRRHKSASGHTVSPAKSSASKFCSRTTDDPNMRLVAGKFPEAAPSSSISVRSRRSSSLGQSLSRLDGNNKNNRKAQQIPPEGSSTHHQFDKQVAQVRSGKAISAHCWLIDTSDDNQSCEPSRTAPQANVSATSLNGDNYSAWQDNKRIKTPETKQHLTLAMKKQLQDRAIQANSSRAQQREQLNLVRERTITTTRSLLNRSDAATAHHDLTINLKTNSLRMERILSRNSVANGSGKNRNSQRCHSASSSTTSGHSSSSERTPVAKTVVRLSALLSLMSSVLKRAPRCLKVSSTNQQPQQDVVVNQVTGASSISGSLAPYTAASLAISSSSSTSAYATGSSHLSSSLSGQQAQNTNRSSKPIAMSRLSGGNKNSGYQNVAGSTAGSSMFYSSSGISVPGLSWHAYDYCDQEPAAGLRGDLFEEIDLNSRDAETQFSIDIKRLAKEEEATRSGVNKPLTVGSNLDLKGVLSGENSSSSCSGTSSSRNGHQQSQSGSGELPHGQANLNPNNILSDHELISVNSDLNSASNEPRSGPFADMVFSPSSLVANAVIGQNVKCPRRRWWWLSMKDALLKSPCNNNSDSDPNLTNHSNYHSGAAQAEASARYKSLKSSKSSRRTYRHQSDAGSTLSNVLMLAKADRDFRIRLLASMVASIILFALILLWASAIHYRGSRFYVFPGKPLVEDLDYDLSWLWPQNQQQRSFAGPLPVDLNQNFAQQNPDSPIPNKVLQIELQVNRPLEQIDSSLRGKLMIIEQSERLNQFQLTMKHLTNIQLANDNFIDLLQLAKHLPSNLEPPSGMSSADYEDFSNNSKLNDFQQEQFNKVQLSEMDHDLVTLTLLSNLHWPLVKWRHQNQQSLAHFLSFAMPSQPASFAGSQTLRNLLSILMLIDSIPANNLRQSDNLSQFFKLNNLLRGASYNIVTCVAHSNNQFKFTGKIASLRQKFCRQLLVKYKRLMLTLSQLNHSHLAKLTNSESLTKSRGRDYGKLSSAVETDDLQLKSSRTLIGFFLDRLALLDVQTIAEAVLVNQDEFELVDENVEQIDQESSVGHLIEAMVLKRDDYFPASGAAFDATGDPSGNVKWQQQQQQQQQQNRSDSSAPVMEQSNPLKQSMPLSEFSKLIVGEGPLKLNLNLEKNKQFQERFLQNSEPANDAEENVFANIQWRAQLAHDILYPWPSFKLPSRVTPTSYNLFLHPNVSSKLVLGMVRIELLVERPTSFIIINSAKLNLLELTLWQKVAPQAKHQDSTINSTNNLDQDTLKSIPIRRLLTNSKLEQIYIELEHDIEPFTNYNNNPTIQQNLNNSLKHMNFGELSQITDRRFQDQGGLSKNRFIMNISFNKTSLMNSPKSPPPDGGFQIENEDESESKINAKEQGLKLLHYMDYFAQPEAEVKTLLYTQFEPNNARRLFPCFDEPKFKAKFQLDLVHEQNQQVLFNAPKRERVPYSSDGALQMSVFEQTPIPISSYLVSFVICDTQNIKSITSRLAQLTSGPLEPKQMQQIQQQHQQQQRHIQIQILAQFEHLSQGEFASQLVPQLLNFYQSHFQFPFPMDKLDLLAIPSGSYSLSSLAQTMVTKISNGKAEGAYEAREDEQSFTATNIDTMENFGLIWFKAPLLLIDTNLISQNLIEQISMIISHQVAHQYVGNIIGLSQWKDLWLYEALCQYLESIGLSHVQPDWRLEEQFVVTTIQETLAMEQFDTGYDSQSIYKLNSEYNNNNQNQQQQQTNSKASVLLEPATIAATTLNNVDSMGKASMEAPLSFVEGRQDPWIQEEGAMSTRRLANGQQQQQQQQPTDHGETYTLDGGEWPAAQEGALVNKPEALYNSAKQAAAVLHMLMLNLLPSVESQLKLLRKCLKLYKYKTMSQAQFWHQFGQQLRLEANLDRLTFDWPPGEERRIIPQGELIGKMFEQSDSSTSSQQQHLSRSNSERVVFVNQRNRLVNSNADSHRIKVRSNSRFMVENLQTIAESWLGRTGYPLVTASMHRDRIVLRQERFSFNWWEQAEGSPSDELGSNTNTGQARDASEPQVWPIPLMYLSRHNPKQSGFFWMNKREMEVSLLDGADYIVRADTLSDGFAGSNKKPHFYYSNGNNWFKLNVNQSSLVRVNYHEKNWEALTELLMKSHYSNHILNPLDRANLLDDSLTLMRCGKLSLGVAMNLTLYLEVGERDYQPWTSVLNHFEQMHSLLNQNPLWHRYVLKLLQPISSVIGWKDDGPHLMRKLRRSLFSVALDYGDEKSVNKAKQEFKAWFKSNRFIVPNLQELVYVAGVRYGDQQEWFHCWQKYQQLVSFDSGQLNLTDPSGSGEFKARNQNDATTSRLHLLGSSSVGSGQTLAAEIISGDPNAENERRQLLSALASTQNTWLLEQFLNYSLDASKIPASDLRQVMQTLGKNPVARLYLWRFVRLNWASLLERYVDGGSGPQVTNILAATQNNKLPFSQRYHQVLESMIVESTKHFTTKLDLDEVKSFFEAKRRLFLDSSGGILWPNSIELAVRKSLSIISGNIYWRDNIEPKLTKWLNHFNS